MGTQLLHDVEAVRRFNRFYTRRIGVLHEGLLRSEFPLAHARVIYELAHRDGSSASALACELGLDPGYLSRILRALIRRGLVVRARSARDRRRSQLSLTDAGRDAFATLNVRSRDEIATLLGQLDRDARARLLGAMHAIEQLLGAEPEPRAAFVLRPHQPGDMGWIVSRHGLRYAEEYGWDASFEALVADIAAQFIRDHDPRCERAWIAEVDGEPAGSVLLVRGSDTVAKLRLLLVEPRARGLGLGSRLIEECIRFAARAGYRTLELWTNDVLHEARHLYRKHGFVRVKAEPHHSFGVDLVGETWQLELRHR